MIDIPEMASSSHLDTFIREIGQVPLLSRCGGPYPERADLRPVGSWNEAMDYIIDMQLDATPRRTLDRLLSDGSRAVNHVLRKGFGAWLSGVLGRETSVETRFRQCVVYRMGQIDSPLIGSNTERIALSEHVSDILTVTSLLIHTKQIVPFEGILRIAELMIQGYLPFDIDEAHNMSILVY